MSRFYRHIWLQRTDHGLHPGGKDRTGILAALILRLAGSSNDAITNDYVLTRIGVEPARGALASSLNLNPAEGLDAGPEKVGMLELCSIRASSMAGFLEAIEELHGGVDGYVRTSLGFSDEDVQKICSNLKGN